MIQLLSGITGLVCREVVYASETESFPLFLIHDGGHVVIVNVLTLSICGR